jgi:hypothetical protein
MVLELARPASWEALARVWKGVQADLELPAPAVAVSGTDALQLWFSLVEPVPVQEAMDVLDMLRSRYLGDVTPGRVRMHPSQASAAGEVRHVTVIPPVEVAPGHWSAFVAPDLAALFADEPWLDLPPSRDAQADLLSRLESTKPDELKRALARPQPFEAPSSQATAHDAEAGPQADRIATVTTPATGGLEPRRFLLDIMNDQSVQLHLRIEAAKALLPYFEGRRSL